MLGSEDWPFLFSLLIQSVLALGLIGFGMVVSWISGREYSDHVVKDLLALPFSRVTMVTAAWWRFADQR